MGPVSRVHGRAHASVALDDRDNAVVASTPTASIVIPTRARPQYLTVTLASVVPQAARAGAEVLVVSDGEDLATAEVAGRHGASLVSLPEPRGANAARNAGVGRSHSELIVFIDDDVDAPAGWLDSLLAGVRATPERDVFGGPIRARLEGGGPKACGRESAPITTLDLGGEDRDVPFVWSANMAVRRPALDRVGEFDETIFVRGDEEDWQRRYAAGGGRVRYLAGAPLTHRRTPADSRLRTLVAAARAQGSAARRNDERKGAAPSLAAEARTLLGCVWHIVRRRCAIGCVLAAHSYGRIEAALAGRRAGAGRQP